MKTILLIAVFALPSYGAEPPAPSQDDPPVRYVGYDKDNVTVIHVRRGIVTRLTFAPDEKIIEDGSARGFPSDCSEPGLEWCVRADAGTNLVLVEPKRGARRKKIELRTNLRDYSFALHVVPDANKSRYLSQPAAAANTMLPMSQVIFTYPADSLATGAALAPLAATAGTLEYLPSEKITIRASGILFSITSGVGDTQFAPSTAFQQAFLKAAQNATAIEILGATDATKADAGSASAARASAENARKYLLDHGIEPGRMTTTYLAARGFVADNATPEGKARNRRVEIDMMMPDRAALHAKE
jgi:flagellar motor protein MotB